MFKHITFLTDFGLQDDFAGVCRGVMKRIAPDVADHRHHARHRPAGGHRGRARCSRRAVPYMPVGVHLAVVDPGRRRRRAARSRSGRATAAVTSAPTTGCSRSRRRARTIEAARQLTNPRYHLEHVSRTFHARDVFAPVAAHLAAGADFDDLGEEVDPATLVCIDLPEPAVVDRRHPRDGARSSTASGTSSSTSRASTSTRSALEPGDRVELRFDARPVLRRRRRDLRATRTAAS